MTHNPPRIVTAVRNKLRTTVGNRFRRFAVAAIAAVLASQATLTACLVVGFTAGKSALAAWMAGAGTSYLVSRWAWERKGWPHLLKETLPFWVVAVGSAIVLTSTTKFAHHLAVSMGLNPTQVVLFSDAAFFLANCVTFVTRFLIFHYILFADRGAKERPSLPVELAAAGSAAGSAELAAESREEPDVAGREEEELAASGSGVWLPGSSARGRKGSGAERSPTRRPDAGYGGLSEPGTRR